MVVCQDERVSRMDDNWAKDIPRICQRLVKAAFGDVNHRDQPLAGIKHDSPQDLLTEKLQIGAGPIDGFRAVECFGTRVLTLGDCRHGERSNQRLCFATREELKQLLNRSTGQSLD